MVSVLLHVAAMGVTETFRELHGIATVVPRMAWILDLIDRFAGLDTPVLIEGETGTGKEMVARALHAASPRAHRPMVVVDCGSLPETLLESELFGHERGSFTGADRAYEGRIQGASGGVLFLDEINSISLAMQGKLLRFLERGEFSRVGKAKPVAVDVRLISASNVPLRQLVESGAMRPDFFYRVNVLHLELPPLRKRLADLPLLVTRFLADDPIARRYRIEEVADNVYAELGRRPWRGNVRELQNVLRQAVILGAEGGVLRSVGPGWESAEPGVERATAGDRAPSPSTFRSWIRSREREYLADLVERYHTVAQQAAVSGLPERTLYRKIGSHGLRGAGLRRRWRELSPTRPFVADDPAALPRLAGRDPLPSRPLSSDPGEALSGA